MWKIFSEEISSGLVFLRLINLGERDNHGVSGKIGSARIGL